MLIVFPFIHCLEIARLNLHLVNHDHFLFLRLSIIIRESITLSSNFISFSCLNCLSTTTIPKFSVSVLICLLLLFYRDQIFYTEILCICVLVHFLLIKISTTCILQVRYCRTVVVNLSAKKCMETEVQMIFSTGDLMGPLPFFIQIVYRSGVLVWGRIRF